MKATIDIRKNVYKGWTCCITVRYLPDRPISTTTHLGYPTLKSALLGTVLHCVDRSFPVKSVQVHGKDVPLPIVYQKIEKAERGRPLTYRVEDVRKALTEVA